MANFAYVARDQLGKIQEGTAEAENDRVLVRRLRERGLWVQQINRVKEVRATAAKKAAPVSKTQGKKKRIGKVKGKDLTMFCRQFSTMINAGVSLVRCLAVLEQQAGSPNLKAVIREVQYSVEGGETLTRSLSRFPRIFTNLFIGLVRAGEVGGVLDETLERLATFLEDDLKLKRKVKSAMTYPVLVLVIAVLIVIGLVTFIVPKFISLFKDFDMTLPGPTLFLISVSNFMTNVKNDIILVATLFMLSIGINRFKATKTGKRIWDKLMLKLPVIGNLNHKIALARFSRTMSTLLVSGVPILQALETVAGAIDNEVISMALLDARAAIREGERIADPLERSKLFPPMVLQMITIGEETGSLDAMLSKVADFYESEVDAALESLTAALEPMLIVFLGGVVGFIVVAMFMPLVKLINGLSDS
ncbi:MAG TPA: type II secretion system F family protein [Armatimonadota bacterium]|jgi:type IV pilus assembly protein PilC